jgi:hypothetical protein
MAGDEKCREIEPLVIDSCGPPTFHLLPVPTLDLLWIGRDLEAPVRKMGRAGRNLILEMQLEAGFTFSALNGVWG